MLAPRPGAGDERSAAGALRLHPGLATWPGGRVARRMAQRPSRRSTRRAAARRRGCGRDRHRDPAPGAQAARAAHPQGFRRLGRRRRRAHAQQLAYPRSSGAGTRPKLHHARSEHRPQVPLSARPPIQPRRCPHHRRARKLAGQRDRSPWRRAGLVATRQPRLGRPRVPGRPRRPGRHRLPRHLRHLRHQRRSHVGRCDQPWSTKGDPTTALFERGRRSRPERRSPWL